jgi:hypothetical protein
MHEALRWFGLEGHRSLSPATPWRIRLATAVAIVGLMWAVGVVQWSVPVVLVFLIASDVYWRRREKH